MRRTGFLTLVAVIASTLLSSFGCSHEKDVAGARVQLQACSLASDCSDGLICALGACREACREARDCGNGGSCVSDGAHAVCQPLSEKDETCNFAQDCPAPLACAGDYQCRNLCQIDDNCNVLGITGRLCARDNRGTSYCAEPRDVVGTMLVASTASHASSADGGSSLDDGGRQDAVPPVDSGSGAGDASAAPGVPLNMPLANTGTIGFSLAIDSTGRAIVATAGNATEKGVPHVWRANPEGSAWEALGTSASDRPVSAIAVRHAIAVDAKDVPYFAFSEPDADGIEGALRVRKFKGGTWSDVGTPIVLRRPTGYARSVAPGQLLFDDTGRLILSVVQYALQDSLMQDNMRAEVYRFDGTNWTMLPVLGDVILRYVGAVDLALQAGGGPILALNTGLGESLEVWRLEGSNWLPTGSFGKVYQGTHVELEWTDAVKLLTWQDAYGNSAKLHVSEFDGSAWHEHPVLDAAKFDNGAPYNFFASVVAGTEKIVLGATGAYFGRAYVLRGGQWAKVKDFRSVDARGVLASRNGQIYSAYSVYNAARVSVEQLVLPQ